MTRVQELCRKLRPVMGKRVDKLWTAYLADDADGKSDIEQTLELLAAKHLGTSYEPDRSPFPPPPRSLAQSGDVPLGQVIYGRKHLFPFHLRSSRCTEHLIIAARSGAGKTNLTFVLMEGMIKAGVHVLAMDWKRGYRDLLQHHQDLRVYTIGRDVSPLRFNPLIPPPGCEPSVYVKIIVDVIASAYLGGDGVISLLVGGIDHLYKQMGVYDGTPQRWPTIADLLAWLRSAKLKGRAALWQASAQRILLAMTYGEFGDVVETQSNHQVLELLEHHVVLEMDGLSSNADRTMFSEALTLYLYRYRLAQGPRRTLTNLIILEEAHNLLLAKQTGTRESVLESSIRMIRAYGMGYVFVDQSASLLSKVAFANSYATIALNQKLSSDIRTMAGAMNLTDEQKQALSTLPIGHAVIRLADQHPEPFLIKVPLSGIREGAISDEHVRAHMKTYSTHSTPVGQPMAKYTAITPISPPDKNNNKSNSELRKVTHPPTLMKNQSVIHEFAIYNEQTTHPPAPSLSRQETRFLGDLIVRPLSTTVSRYQRLHFSRRRGNAIRQHLATSGIIESVPIATRSGQVMLHQLTAQGVTICQAIGIDPGSIPDSQPRPSLVHQFWARQATADFEKRGYEVKQEVSLSTGGVVDLVATRGERTIAIEVETGKSDIKSNLKKTKNAGFTKVILLATGPEAVAPCHRALDSLDDTSGVQLMTWLDVS